jgi:hypothetical protein
MGLKFDRYNSEGRAGGCVLIKLRVLLVSGLLVSGLLVSCFLVSAFLLFVPCLMQGQADDTDSIRWFHPNQLVRAPDLPLLTASSDQRAPVLATSLEIIIHNSAICCAKGSTLEDALLSDPQSLKDLSSSLQGGGGWSDHPPILHVEYPAQDALENEVILAALLNQRASLIQWKSHFYVLYGVVFDETCFFSGRHQYLIHKFLLWDPRFSDERRESEFLIDTDDWGKVQGVMTLQLMNGNAPAAANP